MLDAQDIRQALALAVASAGSRRAANMAIIAMTTSSSIKVKADLLLTALAHWRRFSCD
jgi:hypothetical protein